MWRNLDIRERIVGILHVLHDGNNWVIAEHAAIDRLVFITNLPRALFKIGHVDITGRRRNNL